MDRNYLGFYTALTEMRDESAGILYQSWRRDSNYMERVALVKPSQVSRFHDDSCMESVALVKPSQVPGRQDENYVECIALVKPSPISTIIKYLWQSSDYTERNVWEAVVLR
jgi:hypothetical protein